VISGEFTSIWTHAELSTASFALQVLGQAKLKCIKKLLGSRDYPATFAQSFDNPTILTRKYGQTPIESSQTWDRRACRNPGGGRNNALDLRGEFIGL
jgi:hypothetical protein